MRNALRALAIVAAAAAASACGSAVSPVSSQPVKLCPAAPRTGGSDQFARPVTLTTTADGVQVADLAPGCGALVIAGGYVRFDYTAWLGSGREFDTSRQRARKPLCVQAGSLLPLPGFRHAFDGLRVGAERRLVIPPALAFGTAGAAPVVPPNATIVVDVEVVGVSLAAQRQTACA